MLILGPLGFATHWILAALVVLPVLWLILRAMPPAPRMQDFPGVSLLKGLIDKVPVARRTPWWLLLLRLVAKILKELPEEAHERLSVERRSRVRVRIGIGVGIGIGSHGVWPRRIRPVLTVLRHA